MAASTSDSKRVKIMVGVLGVLALVFVGRMVLSGGGGGSGKEENTSDTVATVPGLGEVPSRDGVGDGGEGESPPPDEFDVFSTKNPFEPAIQVSSPDTSPGSGTTTTTSGSDTGGGTTTSTAEPSFEPPVGATVALVDVYDEAGSARARVQVGSTVYTVGVGDEFATSYRVVSLDDPCGQFLYGDAPFSLCEGEQVIK